MGAPNPQSKFRPLLRLESEAEERKIFTGAPSDVGFNGSRSRRRRRRHLHWGNGSGRSLALVTSTHRNHCLWIERSKRNGMPEIGDTVEEAGAERSWIVPRTEGETQVYSLPSEVLLPRNFCMVGTDILSRDDWVQEATWCECSAGSSPRSQGYGRPRTEGVGRVSLHMHEAK